MTKIIDKAVEVIGKINSTNIRILVTLISVLATTSRYIAGGWTPSESWLGFLIIMSGLDTTHFFAKRKTYDPNLPQNQKPPAV